MTRTRAITVIGGGMAGASIASELAADFAVTLLEQEPHPGYHTTGRSAALFTQNYGNAVVRALTAVSRDFLLQPPLPGVAGPLMTPRGTLFIAAAPQLLHLEKMQRQFAALPVLGSEQICAMVPVLRPQWMSGLWDENAMDIDVDALHQAFLRQAKGLGAKLICNARVVSLTRQQNYWNIETADERRFNANIIINAAGAWADDVAALAHIPPLGLIPKRRTAFLFSPPAELATRNWPAVIDICEQFYFKPDAGLLLGSPGDETPNAAEDVQPHDLDVATAVDRIESATTMQINRVSSKWAGLRTFAPDKSPVVGFDPRAAEFFWFAGQGGYGIQLAPALAQAAASLIRFARLPESVLRAGIDEQVIGPARLIQ